jgi:hypothetical protein
MTTGPKESCIRDFDTSTPQVFGATRPPRTQLNQDIRQIPSQKTLAICKIVRVAPADRGPSACDFITDVGETCRYVRFVPNPDIPIGAVTGSRRCPKCLEFSIRGIPFDEAVRAIARCESEQACGFVFRSLQQR